MDTTKDRAKGPTRNLGMVLLIACLLAVTLMVTTGPSVLGATPPCRVRNVTQDTTGRSLIRMVERAVGGDRLRVRGTCGGPVVVDADLAIRGVGGRPTLTGRKVHRVLRIRSGATVHLRDLRIIHGRRLRPGAGGAGILNHGELTLNGSVVARNQAFDAAGILSWGPLTVRRSRIQGNVAAGSGGGVYAGGATLIVASVIRGNEAYHGGGLFADPGGLVIERSVVVGNRARMGGGIQAWLGELTLTDSVVRHNTARRLGGGIMNHDQTTLDGSIVRGNTAGRRGGGILNRGSLDLVGSAVRGNTAGDSGGGIRNNGTVTLDAASAVTSNNPDDCVGTPAC